MQLLQSVVQARGSVRFPAFAGERVYMHPFTKSGGLLPALARWQPTVDDMLAGVDTPETLFLMIDQASVKAGSTHRRAGVHVDGYWVPSAGGHKHSASCHGGGPSGPTHCPTPRHRPGPGHKPRATTWADSRFDAPEGIILASTVSAARGFVGEYVGPVGEMGDCASVDVSGLEEMPMHAGRVYAGNVCCLHESLPVAADCLRTVVRINAPGWTPTR